ncbi:MAG: hypothetical protein FJ207_11550 [Gemmatimonadetes bacterium]|nr:hypothetical protein [Gemmatimonadota bacterium]
MTHTRRAVGAIALAWAAMTACFSEGDVTFGPEDDDTIQFGTILASTNTSGSAPDADGYKVRLDEGRIEPIDVNGLVTFSSVKPGTYNVTLSDYAANCLISGSNPVPILLQTDSLRQAHFDLVCN